MTEKSPTAFVQRFVKAMESSDMATVKASFAPERTSIVTNTNGGTDLVEGSEALGQRFPDFAAMADSFNATVTQVHEIDNRTILFMVEIRAQRLGRSLHNFAGIFLRLTEDYKIAEYRMVEALPSASDHF